LIDCPQAEPTASQAGGQLGLDLVHDASKSGLVVHGDVRQHFTVDFDVQPSSGRWQIGCMS
jgi:hypothetical protein